MLKVELCIIDVFSMLSVLSVLIVYLFHHSTEQALPSHSFAFA